jgi:aspartyl-tRNA(Asn)/glutamyl-tRNA(Gln) amidotransferase subunit C
MNREEVLRVAELARLEIPADGIERVRKELSAVLEFVETLKRLDLEGCEPTTFAPADGKLREDVTDGRRLTPAEALAGAPEHEDTFFLVPPIVENLNP